MLFEAWVVCPMCSRRFRVHLRSPRRPAAGDLFEVVCPYNGSRFQFFALGPGQTDSPAPWPAAIALREVRWFAHITGAVRVGAREASSVPS
jgi:hypothetical protein